MAYNPVPTTFFDNGVTLVRDVALLDANFAYTAAKVLSVKDFGAKGDNSTNDLPAIQAAHDAVFAAGGGVVNFPRGTFIVNGSINYADNVSFIGSGRGATTIKLASGSGLTGSKGIFAPTVNAVLPPIGYNSKNNVIAHLSVDGNIAGNAGGVYEGIAGYQVKDLLVYDVEAFNCGEVGLQGQVTNKNTDQKSLITFLACISHNNVADGIQVGGANVISCWSYSNGANGISSAGNFVSGNVDDIETNIIGCRAEYNGSSGISANIQTGPGIRTLISSCTSIHNSGHGFAANMNQTKMVNCTAEFNTLSGFMCDHNNCVITGGSASSNTQNGFLFPGAVLFCKVSGVLCTSNGAWGVAFTAGLGSGSHNTMTDVTLSVNGSGTIQNASIAGTDWAITNCEGFNPAGPFGGAATPANPAVPATTVAKTNTYGYPVRIFIAGGTVSAVFIAGIATGLTGGSFVLGSNETIAIVYTVVPTWQWFGL